MKLAVLLSLILISTVGHAHLGRVENVLECTDIKGRRLNIDKIVDAKGQESFLGAVFIGSETISQNFTRIHITNQVPLEFWSPHVSLSIPVIQSMDLEFGKVRGSILFLGEKDRTAITCRTYEGFDYSLTPRVEAR